MTDAQTITTYFFPHLLEQGFLIRVDRSFMDHTFTDSESCQVQDALEEMIKSQGWVVEPYQNWHSRYWVKGDLGYPHMKILWWLAHRDDREGERLFDLSLWVNLTEGGEADMFIDYDRAFLTFERKWGNLISIINIFKNPSLDWFPKDSIRKERS